MTSLPTDLSEGDPLDDLVEELPPPADPLDDLVEDSRGLQLGRARDGVRLAARLDSKTAGRSLELSATTGLPPDTVERNLPELEQDQRARELPWDQVSESAELQRYLADPQRAAAVRDDVPHMLSFRRALLSGGPVQAVPGTQEPGLLEALGARFESGRLTAFDIPDRAGPLILSALGLRPPASFEERRAWRELRARPRPRARRSGIADDILGAPIEQLPIIARIAKGSLVGGGLTGAVGAAGGAGVGALAGGVGAGPGAAAGFTAGFASGAPAGAALSSFIIESGNAFDEFYDLKDEQGQPLPEEVIAAGASIVGAINAGLEFAGFQAVAKRIPGLDKLVGKGRGVITETVTRQMRSPALRAQLMAAAREVAQALGAEVATELAQETVNIEAGRVLTGEGVGLDAEDAGRLGDTAVQTAFGVLPLVGVGQGVRLKLDRVAQAQQNAAQLQLAQEAVAQAQVRQVSPTTFGELTDALAREAGIEDVRIPAQALLDAWVSQSGLIEEQAAQELALAVPEVASQLGEALATGGDVRIPAARYFGTLADRFGGSLLQDVRLRPEDMTLREAQRAELELPEQVQREVELAAAAAEREAPAPTTAVPPEGPHANSAADPSVVDLGATPPPAAAPDATNAPHQNVASPAAPHAWATEALRKAKTKKATAEVLALVRAQDELGLAAPLFADPAGVMTGPEFAEYRGVLDGARAKAQEKLAAELSAEARERAKADRAEQRTFKRVRKDFEREATAEVDRSPVEQARAWLTLRVDKDAAPEQRLDRDVLREYGKSPYGGDWADVVPRGMVQVGGLHPDFVAELFGFESGLELVDALVSAPAREQAIQDGTEARMLARFGDQEAKRVEAAVIDAAANDEQFRALQIEERVLSRLTGGSSIDRRTVQAAARRLLAARRVKDVSPQAYRAQARRSALAAVEAMGQQDYESARHHKRAQILNLTLEQEARAAVEEIERGERSLRRFARAKATRARIAKAAEGEHLRQIDALLERFELRRQPPVGERQALADWVAERDTAGDPVIVAPALQRENLRMPWRTLSLEAFRDLRDAVKNIAELAKRETEIITRTEKAQLETVEARIIEAIEAQFPRDTSPARATPSKLDNAKAWARSVDASLRKAEFVIDALSGDDPNSMLRRFVWEPLRDAQGAYTAKLGQYSKALEKLRDERGAVVKTWGRELPETRLRDEQGRQMRLTKWNVVMIALNHGNASNLEKLLGGYGWDPATVAAVLDTHLDAADWRFVQGVWDLIDQLWPDIAKMERRMTGVTPPRVEAQTVRTRFGDFRGGFFPVVYDPARSQTGQKAESAKLMPGPSEGFTRATTGHGHTIERTSAAAPILLDSSVIASHLDQVILDLTHREALVDAQRVLSRKGVDGAISRALGREFGFRDFWLRRLHAVARDTADPGAMRGWERASRWVRTRGTVFKLGLNYMTLLVQPSGLFNGLRAIQQAGGTSEDLVYGMWRAYGGFNPARAAAQYRAIAAVSPFMRDRLASSNQELRDLVREAGTTGKLTAKAQAFSMSLIGRVQLRIVDVPVWIGAHRAAIRQGMTEERAIRAADAAVSKSQGGGARIDQSAFESSSGGWRAANMFVGYSLTLYNQLFRKGKLRTERLADYALEAASPGLFSWALYAALRGQWPDPDDDDYEKDLLRAFAEVFVGSVANTIPFVRDVWTIPIGERARNSSALEILEREGFDLFNVTDQQDFLFDLARVGTLAAGLPGNAPFRLAEDLARDEE